MESMLHFPLYSRHLTGHAEIVHAIYVLCHERALDQVVCPYEIRDRKKFLKHFINKSDNNAWNDLKKSPDA